MSGLRSAFSFRKSLDNFSTPSILRGMAKTQKSLSFVQVATQYRLTKATNTLDFQIGKLYEKTELQKVIDSGIQVTITNNK